MTFAVPDDLNTGDVFPESWADQVRDNFTAMSAWSSYTPTWTQSATVTKTVNHALYVRLGDLVIGFVKMTATGAGGSAVALAGLPAAHNLGLESLIGSYWFQDTGTTNYVGAVVTASGAGGTTVKFLSDASPTYFGSGGPTIASGDVLLYQFTYQAQ